tara:strand:+ start:9894 stop:10025 length:132 start_codon:yes stop_codon:yes gene_type:complete
MSPIRGEFGPGQGTSMSGSGISGISVFGAGGGVDSDGPKSGTF